MNCLSCLLVEFFVHFLIFSVASIFFVKSSSEFMHDFKTIAFQVSLIFLQFCDQVRLSTINCLGESLACMNSRSEKAVIESSLRFISWSLVLHSSIAQLLYQILTILQVLDLFFLLFVLIYGNLSSLCFSYGLLPSLPNTTSLRVIQICGELPRKHLFPIFIFLDIPQVLAMFMLIDQLYKQFTLII